MLSGWSMEWIKRIEPFYNAVERANNQAGLDPYAASGANLKVSPCPAV